MTHRTIEAIIENGRVTGPESATLPASAHVLITLLSPEERRRPAWRAIRAQIGKLRLREETQDWQRDMRSEWDR